MSDGKSVTSLEPVPAVQYLRMSTERQVYSTAYQAERIARYAAERGFEITRTFADEGRSGLTLRGRPGLQQLLSEVLSGHATFKAVLIYDVSRWGRFQDSDESAHYEFLCRNADIAIHYCAEPFDNDGSVTASLLKHIKRVMAGEYSRELSSRIFASQVRLARMGYRVGGRAPLGLRRLLLDGDDQPKTILEEGEHKFLRSDKIVLVPGPENEIETVRLIFELAGAQGMTNRDIARELDRREIAPPRAGQWNPYTVDAIIRNEIYIGTLIYNRRSYKLKGAIKINPKAEWIRHENHLVPLVGRELFDRAHASRRRSRLSFDRDQLLGELRALLSRHGYLSLTLIARESPVKSRHWFKERFGSLRAAYDAIGYSPGAARNVPHHKRSELFALIRRTENALRGHGAVVDRPDAGPLLEVDGSVRLGVLLSSCQPATSTCARHARLPTNLEADLIIIKLPKQMGSYLLCPASAFPESGELRIGPKTLERLSAYKMADLGEAYARINALRAHVGMAGSQI